MIASVRGEVTAIDLDHAVVEVGGVGLAVHATPATLATLRRGERAALATALVVREDSLTLYGFADAAARELFVLLQTVAGVGPRLAMAVLAVLDPDRLRTAVAEGDTAVLTQVPGIGRKGAERLVIELRDKIGTVARPALGLAGPAVAGDPVRDQVVEALVGLGFPARQAEQAVQAVLAEPTGPVGNTGNNGSGTRADTAAVLRGALSRLGRNR
jgi:Holliday junction DNA helicase RuvA